MLAVAEWSMSDELFYARLFAVVLLGAIGFAVVALMRPFAGPLCWAAILAFVLHPLNLRLRRRFGDRRGLAALILTIAVVVGVAVPTLSIAVAFVKEVAQLVKRISELGSVSDLGHLPLVERSSDWLAARLSISTDRLFAFLSKNLSGMLSVVFAESQAILVGIVGIG